MMKNNYNDELKHQFIRDNYDVIVNLRILGKMYCITSIKNESVNLSSTKLKHQNDIFIEVGDYLVNIKDPNCSYLNLKYFNSKYHETMPDQICLKDDLAHCIVKDFRNNNHDKYLNGFVQGDFLNEEFFEKLSLEKLSELVQNAREILSKNNSKNSIISDNFEILEKIQSFVNKYVVSCLSNGKVYLTSDDDKKNESIVFLVKVGDKLYDLRDPNNKFLDLRDFIDNSHELDHHSAKFILNGQSAFDIIDNFRNGNHSEYISGFVLGIPVSPNFLGYLSEEKLLEIIDKTKKILSENNQKKLLK